MEKTKRTPHQVTKEAGSGGSGSIPKLNVYWNWQTWKAN